jgi:hypothetical protein
MFTPQVTPSPSPPCSPPGMPLPLPFPNLLGESSNVPYADIILRSSDSHEFRVQKFYVMDSSPVLRKRIMATSCYVARQEGKPHLVLKMDNS